MEVSNLFKELPFSTDAIEEEVTIILQDILSNVLSADMSKTDNEKEKDTIIQNLNETNTEHLEKIDELEEKIDELEEKIDELKEKYRLKVKELRITQAIAISKDLQIISLQTKITEIEKTEELPFSTHHAIEEEEILSNVSSAASTVLTLQTKAPAGGDMQNVTKKEPIKIRRGWIGKTWRRVKRATTFLCCVR